MAKHNIKVLTIAGARPQFVKAAVISREIAAHNSSGEGPNIQEIIIHTGQHHDDNMSAIFFEQMQIPRPYYNLGVSGCAHGAMTGRMLEQIEKVILSARPDVVLVYGDTNSTLAGALAAAKQHVPVAHVEAGLRSFKMNMPEEINRILTDHISSFLFCPTETAVNNLLREGIDDAGRRTAAGAPSVMNVGDVMYDAVRFYRHAAGQNRRSEAITGVANENYYLATIHREENTDDYNRLRGIAEALETIAASTPVILPLHPRTRKALREYGLHVNRVTLTEPVGYFDMLTLLDGCKAVFTDSGGLQKEAYFFKKPCVTLRDETEWVELVKHGVNIIAGAGKDAIIETERHLTQANMNFSTGLYGHGDAGSKIVKALSSLVRGA
ncbi:MAG: UDP-N-acetylglucosamine 2-epimerase (non-hydrolyzing) [Nitrospiraceae bacterium]|nr:UDP-N-acetylglucosamine 2-epimerase (non-hydrolyzing) [Nitrospiraceae bacterium]